MKIEQNIKYVLAGACFSLSLAAFTPMVHAQAAGAGASGAAGSGAAISSGPGSATRGSGPTGNNGVTATSPSTLGGSVSGSTTDPAVPGSTAGDTAVHHGATAGNMTSTNPSSSAMSPAAYGNDREPNTTANHAVIRRERHAMNHHRHHRSSQSTTTTTESE
jgi:hypothetical protein